jgi:hypothetical protein
MARLQFIPTAEHWGFKHALDSSSNDGAVAVCGKPLNPWGNKVCYTQPPDCEPCKEKIGLRLKSMFAWKWVQGKGPLYQADGVSWHGRADVKCYTYSEVYDYGSDYASEQNVDCHAPMTFEALQAYFEEHDGSSPEQPKVEGVLFIQYTIKCLEPGATSGMAVPIDACRVIRKGFGL